MNKKSRAKKHEIALREMPIHAPKKGVKTKRVDPGKKLRDPNFVAKAFFRALMDNDVDAALDALSGYLLAMSKTDIAEQGRMATSTVYYALSQGANPTLRTLAKLLHATKA